jgi:hypothetical protein
MISFIIPTIYKSKKLIQLLRNLDVHPLVSEILLIEDCTHTGMLDGYNFNKLNVVPFQERKYCNGGWNLGVSLVKTHYYALCNDDILFPTSIIDDVFHFYKFRPKSGFIGMHPTQLSTYSASSASSQTMHSSRAARSSGPSRSSLPVIPAFSWKLLSKARPRPSLPKKSPP